MARGRAIVADRGGIDFGVNGRPVELEQPMPDHRRSFTLDGYIIQARLQSGMIVGMNPVSQVFAQHVGRRGRAEQPDRRRIDVEQYSVAMNGYRFRRPVNQGAKARLVFP